MLTIEFKVDEDILARKMISKSQMPTDFANYLWDKFRCSYMMLQKNIDSREIDENILTELQNQVFFADYVQKSNKNLARIKKNWQNCQEMINDFLAKIMRLDFNLALQCCVVAPELNTGVNIGNNCFIWGHENGVKDKNYDLVYLVHESLHAFFDRDRLSHVIIENIADVGLSKFLNKSAVGYSYHDFLHEDHVKVFPFWNLYLNKSKNEIKRAQDDENIKYDIEKFERYREKVSKMNINEFLAFLQENAGKITFKRLYQIN